MKKEPISLPLKASEFIHIHYPQSIVESVKTFGRKDEDPGYLVILSRDELVTHLHFDPEGRLVSESDEPLYMEDYYEGDFYGNE